LNIYLVGASKNLTVDRLAVMKSVGFAHFSAIGTWVDERHPCESCEWHWQTLSPPLLVQWEPSTDQIGDFSWDGGYVFVVKGSVAKRLAALRFECQCLAVDYVKPERKRNTVAFPYVGPKLFWGECKATLDLNMKASKVKCESACAECGDMRYTFRYKNIAIRRKAWRGQKMFRITTNGRSSATFVTEEGRLLLENEAFTNIGFSLAGNIGPLAAPLFTSAGAARGHATGGVAIAPTHHSL
jgi:hypothetical protein